MICRWAEGLPGGWVAEMERSSGLVVGRSSSGGRENCLCRLEDRGQEEGWKVEEVPGDKVHGRISSQVLLTASCLGCNISFWPDRVSESLV